MIKSKDILYIDDLIVDKDYRNKGIGKQLLQNATKYAKERDCLTVELKSYINNVDAYRFYENNGLHKVCYDFKLYLNWRKIKYSNI